MLIDNFLLIAPTPHKLRSASIKKKNHQQQHKCSPTKAGMFSNVQSKMSGWLPSMPAMPAMPAMPSMPAMPNMPNVSMPAMPSIPNIPGLKSKASGEGEAGAEAATDALNADAIEASGSGTRGGGGDDDDDRSRYIRYGPTQHKNDGIENEWYRCDSTNQTAK